MSGPVGGGADVGIWLAGGGEAGGEAGASWTGVVVAVGATGFTGTEAGGMAPDGAGAVAGIGPGVGGSRPGGVEGGGGVICCFTGGTTGLFVAGGAGGGTDLDAGVSTPSPAAGAPVVVEPISVGDGAGVGLGSVLLAGVVIWKPEGLLISVPTTAVTVRATVGTSAVPAMVIRSHQPTTIVPAHITGWFAHMTAPGKDRKGKPSRAALAEVIPTVTRLAC